MKFIQSEGQNKTLNDYKQVLFSELYPISKH